MIYSKFRFLSSKGGFTLIEMLVVVAIFSIIMGAVIGVFVSAIRAQRYSLATQQLLDQTSYAMEYMSRFIRMAKKEEVDGLDCIVLGKNYKITRSGKGLKFNNYHGQCQEFYWDGTKLVLIIVGEYSLDLTSNDLEVTDLNFYVSGDGLNDDEQPRVTIFLEAEAVHSKPRPKIKIQTTVSQRNPDI